MTGHVLWTPGVALGPLRVDGPEGHHGADVRRLRAGEAVEVVDGHGTRGRAVVDATGPGWLQLDVSAVAHEVRPEPWVVVAQGLAKGERAELAVELCSEVGVDEIIPWRAARSVTRWDTDRAARGEQRWQSAAREAGKQARRARFCQVAPTSDTDALLDRAAAADLAVVLDPAAGLSLGGLSLPSSGEVLLVVGPEGGVTPEEMAGLSDAGAVAARLGPSVLRTSGAGAVAAAVVLARTARWAVPPT